MTYQDKYFGMPNKPSVSEKVTAPTTAPQPDDQTVENAKYKNRRRWVRYAVDIPVHVRVITQGPTRIVACDGRGINLNCGGLAVLADIDLPVGAQIRVEFTPPYAKEPMAFRCFVRDRVGNRYGVEFITENDEDYRKAGELQKQLAAMHEQVARR